MRSTRSLSITLPNEMADMVRRKVASGEYATESEVIRDGLRILSARDQVVERWLGRDVLPILQANEADASRLVDADAAWRLLDAHMKK